MSVFDVVVVISAGTEWRAVRARLPDAPVAPSPYGEWFETTMTADDRLARVTFFHGGWGKIAAAASTQYALDRWHPDLLVNLGTCGGFEGAVERDTIILATGTRVYDIVEQMGDPAAALAHYAVDLDLPWLQPPYPQPVQPGLLLSGDRDLVPEELADLQARYDAVAGDWESGAIAYVAARNGVPCLILRGVTDLVGPDGGEAYDGTVRFFHERAPVVMARLLEYLPAWLSRACVTGRQPGL
jgi:adenosylhomocysteine nucleosidase